MDNIKGVSGQPYVNYQPTASAPSNAPAQTNFDQLFNQTQKVSYKSELSGENPLNQIPVNLLPMSDSKKNIVGSQMTFLGTFSKQTEANISRTDDKIIVNSPLGNMKMERSGDNPGMIYVEMPQGNFTGNISVKNDNKLISIESEDKCKAIFIEVEENGDMKVTNKGIQENIKLTFKKS